MASIGYIKFTKHSLNRMLEVLNESKEDTIEVTFAIKDIVNKNDSVNVWEMQTQDEIKSKEEKRYLSKEGKVFWTNEVSKVETSKNSYKRPRYSESYIEYKLSQNNNNY